MKILHTVEFYEPRKGGAEEVVKQLSERLVKAGHTVTVATTFDADRTVEATSGVKIESFKISGNAAQGFKGEPSEINRYQRLLTGDFDIVLNYAAQSWTTDLAFEVLKSIPATKILVPCGYSGLRNPAYQEYFAKLPEYLALYDALIYMSENYQDIIFGAQHRLAGKAVIIPNGASEEEFTTPDTYNFKEKYGIKTSRMALCVANHYVAKGHQFVIEAFLKMRRADTTLVIIGEKSVSHGLKSFGHLLLDYWRCKTASIFNTRIKMVSGAPREAVVSAYKEADIFLFGSRVECAPLVMYESFAGRTPFIATPVGNVTDHADYLSIVRTPAEMASVASGLLNDESKRQEMASRAYELWQEKHTWAKISQEYEKLYRKLCK